MITSDNRIKIIDFGLANKQGFPDLMAEDFHTPHGTPFYISPEQILGFRMEPKSDLYSLGIMFYEMVTSHLPYNRSKKLSQVRKRLKHEPIPPRYFNPDLPPQIQQIILRTIERHPDNRYDSVAAMCRDLRDYKNIEVTELGQKVKPQGWLSALFSSPITLTRDTLRENRKTIKANFHILGCIVDDDESDHVIEAAKCHALLNDGDVTLLYVIDEDIDMEYRKYGAQVEGEKFSHRIEKYIQILRRYDIDPTIRIIPGHVKETISAIAARIDCNLILLGFTRKKGGKLFSFGSIDKISTRSGCRLLICDGSQCDPETEMMSMSPADISVEEMLEIDLFFIDLWFEHLGWLSDSVYGMLLDKNFSPDVDPSGCRMGIWLENMRKREEWRGIVEPLALPHLRVHQNVKKLQQVVKQGDLQAMKKMYQGEYQEIACALLDGLRNVSIFLHKRCGGNTQPVAILGQQGCPLYASAVPYGGPLLKLKQVEQYLEADESRPEGGL